jgi:hypothetical protein
MVVTLVLILYDKKIMAHTENDFKQAYTDIDISNAVEDIRPMKPHTFKKAVQDPDREFIDMYMDTLDVAQCANAFNMSMGSAIEKLKDFGVL